MLPTMVIAVICSYVVMVLSNVLASKKAFGGKDNKQISDEHPTFVSPDGPTFAIWGIIYLFETVTVIAQAFPSDSTEELLGQRCPLTGLDVRERLVAAFLTNAIWLPVFNNERFWSALVIMVVYLGFLLGIYTDVNVTTTTGIYDRLCFVTGITMNASWIVVATMVNTFFCLGEVGWKDEHGAAGSVPAAILAVVVVAVLGAGMALVRCELAWAFVSAWALRGIFRMQTVPDKVRFPLASMSSTLGSCARWCSWGVVLTMVVGVGYAVAVRKGLKLA
uniref:Transmembrane protein n=1 Tax=Alexandrium andersonii TaxID=327968 RepID=A0A7S2B2D6_9DINO